MTLGKYWMRGEIVFFEIRNPGGTALRAGDDEFRAGRGVRGAGRHQS